MKSPFTGGKVELRLEKRKMQFRNREYDCSCLFYVCLDSGEEFTTEEIDTLNVQQIYNQYRVDMGIPFADEIRALRSYFEVSAIEMSKILGFGDNQYRLYENGEMPSVSNGRFLSSIIHYPSTILSCVEKVRGEIKEKSYERIFQKISNYNVDTEKAVYKKLVYNYGRDVYNGFAHQSLGVLKNAILFFIEKKHDTFKTTLNKLLFYSDFLSYKIYGIGITGLSYKAIQYGPVPLNWYRLYSVFDEINTELVSFDNGVIGERLVSDIPYDRASLTEEQKSVLEKVSDAFKNDNANSISTKSHEEVAWLDNYKSKSIIDYNYAFCLKAI